MKENKAIVTAVFVSLFAHSVFFATSVYMRLPGMQQIERETRKMFRIKEIEEKTVRVSLFQGEIDEAPVVKMVEDVSKE